MVVLCNLQLGKVARQIGGEYKTSSSKRKYGEKVGTSASKGTVIWPPTTKSLRVQKRAVWKDACQELKGPLENTGNFT